MITPVIVAGTGRSGTSTVARLCQELGVDMGGPGNTDRASNLGGDWERQSVKDVNDAFSEKGITARQHRDGLLYIADEQDGPWGFKHPKASEYFQQLIGVFPRAHVIWCQRDLDATAESWSRWYGRSPESCMNSIKRRDRVLRALLDKRRGTLKLDMTNRWDEDDLSVVLESYLKERGVL